MWGQFFTPLNILLLGILGIIVTFGTIGLIGKKR